MKQLAAPIVSCAGPAEQELPDIDARESRPVSLSSLLSYFAAMSFVFALAYTGPHAISMYSSRPYGTSTPSEHLDMAEMQQFPLELFTFMTLEAVTIPEAPPRQVPLRRFCLSQCSVLLLYCK